MKKQFFFAAVALVALASCSNEEIIGDSPTPSPHNGTGPEKAIVFNSGTNATTRATHTGAEAAGMLDNKFVFVGTKGVNGIPTGATTASYVFDNYTAKYVTGTAHTTESNSDNWEYVGIKAATPSTIAGNWQTIKYWDYAETQYDFVAYSLGEGFDDDADPTTDPVYATPSAINPSTKSYTLTGSADALKACYVSDLVTAYNLSDGAIVANDFGNVVQFSFRSLATKIRIAFYETIPGYSVKNIQFYNKAAGETGVTLTDVPTLYASGSVLPTGSGTMTVSFNTATTGGWANSPQKANNTDYNKAHVSFAATNTSDLSANVNFGKLLNYPADYEGALTSGSFIGRTSNTATYADGYQTGSTTTPNARGYYYTILPFETGANLTLRIKYTLVSTDGSAEEIVVDNASAVVPAELAQWNPNYAYTYIFKISDITNGSTGEDGDGNVVTGLTPITLNAVVVDSEDGLQETITSVSAPSITTYTQGKVVTTQSEYNKNANIYVIVNNGTSNIVYDAAKFKLYTATIGGTDSDPAAQKLTEKSVANALANGTYDSSAKTYTVTDANGKNLVLTESTLLGASTAIVAADSPTGNEISVNGAVFKPTTAGTYVFEYIKTPRVAAVLYDATTAATYNASLTGAVASGGATPADYETIVGSAAAGGTLTDEEAKAYNAKLTGAVAAGDVATPANPGEYFYKIIIVL